MVLALMLSLLVPAPSSTASPAVRSEDPPVRVWLNQDDYFERGDRARVNIKLSEDGYLLVLRADADGRVRVLFPLDPGDDAFVRGGRRMEVRGRGDREAFRIDEREGTGVVLAARSVAPFRFDEFVRGDHWDYRVLGAQQAGGDEEAALLDMVQQMVSGGHFDYDVVTYTVASPHAYHGHRYYSSVGLHLGFGYGWPRYRWPHYRYGFGYYGSSCFDPFFYDPFFCGSAFYDPFFYGYSPFFYDPFFYDPFSYGPFVYRYRPFIYRPFIGVGVIRRGPLAFKGPAAGTVRGIGPRLRVPQGTLLRRPVSPSGMARTPVRVRDVVSGPSATFPVHEPRSIPSERRVREARIPERRDGGRVRGGPAPERCRDPVVSGRGRVPAGGGRDRGWSAPKSSGSGRSFAPSNSGGGRRRP